MNEFEFKVLIIVLEFISVLIMIAIIFLLINRGIDQHFKHENKKSIERMKLNSEMTGKKIQFINDYEKLSDEEKIGSAKNALKVLEKAGLVD